MIKTIKWGILGCGDVTEKKSGPGFAKANNSELVAVMRRNTEQARDYAKRHNVPKWYDDAQQLIDDPDVDAIYIATRPDSHNDLAQRCAQARKPTLVEKPLARTAIEAQEIVAAFAAHQTPLFCAYYRRSLPRFQRVKDMLDTGTIGQVRFACVLQVQPEPLAHFDNNGLPWRYDPAIGGGGVFMDMGSHAIDILDYFLGPIVSAQGLAINQGGHYPAEDGVAATFKFDTHTFASGLWCYSAFDQQDEIKFVGTQGEITFACFAPTPIRVVTSSETKYISIADPEHVHQPLIQTIVDELNCHGHCPSTAQSALRVNKAIDQILQDYRHQ